MKIIQLSDTHISQLGGVTADNLQKFITLINDINPTLVVHSGDIAILDPDNNGDREFAKQLLQGIQAPLRVIPGNHDVGERPENAWAGLVVTPERLNAFTSTFGPDHWLELAGNWAVIGLNSEIMGSGLPEEDAQWAWLETIAAEVGERPALIFTHKPVFNPYPQLTEHNIAIPDESRRRLLDALTGVTLAGFGSGHLHEYAVSTQQIDGTEAVVVSAPATGFAHGGLGGPALAQLGIVEYQLGEGEKRGAVQPFFRNLATLTEVPPTEIAEFTAALDHLGVTL
ncbi:metallophosphoesterase family protein [Subtercola endophyticus]|uniref:metallophosphoesterase family protein n=1 Tax=Subtercola endophyticus TaxID=2895559 RepID=UPI001E3A86D0|nr:metallophosphoesterase [Subtercola endophyticus]UFS60641.1 metallophosphoesterase [Subtercola endophyticus]